MSMCVTCWGHRNLRSFLSKTWKFVNIWKRVHMSKVGDNILRVMHLKSACGKGSFVFWWKIHFLRLSLKCVFFCCCRINKAACVWFRLNWSSYWTGKQAQVCTVVLADISCRSAKVKFFHIFNKLLAHLEATWINK